MNKSEKISVIKFFIAVIIILSVLGYLGADFS
jgi:hypothetical protein